MFENVERIDENHIVESYNNDFTSGVINYLKDISDKSNTVSSETPSETWSNPIHEEIYIGKYYYDFDKNDVIVDYDQFCDEEYKHFCKDQLAEFIVSQLDKRPKLTSVHISNGLVKFALDKENNHTFVSTICYDPSLKCDYFKWNDYRYYFAEHTVQSLLKKSV